MKVGALRDGRLRVREPFSVRKRRENDDFTMEATEIGEFGFGKNPTEALADLQRAVAELFFYLECNQAQLGRDLERIWGILQRKIVRVQQVGLEAEDERGNWPSSGAERL